MKKTEKTEINYRPVVFKDSDADFAFLTRSTVETRETIVWKDGKEYPLYKMEISSASHPFFTGQQKIRQPRSRRKIYEAIWKASRKEISSKNKFKK